MNEIKTVKLADYAPSAFLVTHHELHFDLQDTYVQVRHRQTIQCTTAQPENNLQLHGENLTLLHISIDGKPLSAEAYCYQDDYLTIYTPPKTFTLETVVRLNPDDNRELSGLYRSNGIYCTQCEAEGFRRISFALDRPDILSTYHVRIEGDKRRNPVMLSNGNLVEQGDLSGNRHYVCWDDPYPKPSYLFALVAGNLAQVSQQITTPKGKTVTLYIYAESAYIKQTDYAMQALVDAFSWDEMRFNLSYDLDRFNIVVISDFNMGAMENKSLNIFNTKYVLATPDTATDSDFLAVQNVIGHEYFHNWTGNRITCRDWFQLSLKEGLTVFRDQEFSADLNERDLQRIRDVSILRRIQFNEDAGPLRHPVQPQEYAAIDNFYTATVYEKGAEIIRMYHTILGEEMFQKGMACYIQRHDGQAVCIEDFAQCMQDVSGFAFREHFFQWYTTAGTPRLTFRSNYDQEAGEFQLSAEQDISGLSPARPLLIPIRFALMKETGECCTFDDGETQKLLLLERMQDSWTFSISAAEAIPVLMMGFSAPVHYHYDYSLSDLTKLALHAPDGFARYEAMQHCYRHLFCGALDKGVLDNKAVTSVAGAMQHIFKKTTFTPAEKALLLEFPSLNMLIPYLSSPIDIEAAVVMHQQIIKSLAQTMQSAWIVYWAGEQYAISPEYSVSHAGIRALRSVAMKALARLNDNEFSVQLFACYQHAACMTEQIAALEALAMRNDRYYRDALIDFYERFKSQPLVIDKWFSLQTEDTEDAALAKLEQLAQHSAFNVSNPNRFRALLGAFMTKNWALFHQRDGKGYDFAITQIKRVIVDNPQLSARMLSNFSIVSRLDAERQTLVAQKFDELLALPDLSEDVREVIVQILRGIT